MLDTTNSLRQEKITKWEVLNNLFEAEQEVQKHLSYLLERRKEKKFRYPQIDFDIAAEEAKLHTIVKQLNILMPINNIK